MTNSTSHHHKSFKLTSVEHYACMGQILFVCFRLSTLKYVSILTKPRYERNFSYQIIVQCLYTKLSRIMLTTLLLVLKLQFQQDSAILNNYPTEFILQKGGNLVKLETRIALPHFFITHESNCLFFLFVNSSGDASLVCRQTPALSETNLKNFNHSMKKN